MDDPVSKGSEDDEDITPEQVQVLVLEEALDVSGR